MRVRRASRRPSSRRGRSGSRRVRCPIGACRESLRRRCRDRAGSRRAPRAVQATPWAWGERPSGCRWRPTPPAEGAARAVVWSGSSSLSSDPSKVEASRKSASLSVEPGRSPAFGSPPRQSRRWRSMPSRTELIGPRRLSGRPRRNASTCGSGPPGFVGVPGRLEPLAGRAERPGQFVPGRLNGPVVRLVHRRTPSPRPAALPTGLPSPHSRSSLAGRPRAGNSPTMSRRRPRGWIHPRSLFVRHHGDSHDSRPGLPRVAPHPGQPPTPPADTNQAEYRRARCPAGCNDQVGASRPTLSPGPLRHAHPHAATAGVTDPRTAYRPAKQNSCAGIGATSQLQTTTEQQQQTANPQSQQAQTRPNTSPLAGLSQI